MKRNFLKTMHYGKKSNYIAMIKEAFLTKLCWLKRKGLRTKIRGRSSRLELFCRKSVLRNFTKFTGKYLCQSLFFNKVAGLWHRCFPVNSVKFLRTPFLQNTSGRLLLEKCKKRSSSCA